MTTLPSSIMIEVKTPSLTIHLETRDQEIMKEYHGLIKDMAKQYIISETFKEQVNRKMLDIVAKKETSKGSWVSESSGTM